ncbi:MAG: 5-bromo-4-chloroindolyl phosphate hydrolysis family protein [Bacillota bacterium]|nr:5-bromo-4-chloroindolyl phosphate hydrolysis family protein [Bacillota bacterium]
MKESTRAFLAFIAGLLAFALTYFRFTWPLPVSALIALLIYGAVFLLTKPVKRIGKTRVDNLKGGQELLQIMSDAHEDMQVIYKASEITMDGQIDMKAKKLHELGNRILTYLGNNPQKISSARRFFSFYLDTGANILTKYMNLVSSNPDSPQVQRLTPETARALDILYDAFMAQFNKLMQNEVMDVEADIDLLEKTLHMEGGL